MAAPSTPPKLPRLEPMSDAIVLGCIVDLPDLPKLPKPALATWEKLQLLRFYSAHLDLKQDLLKKRIRGVCTLRFQEHVRRIPQQVRELYEINVPPAGGPRCGKNGSLQSLMCRRIDALLDAFMMFWGCDSL